MFLLLKHFPGKADVRKVDILGTRMEQKKNGTRLLNMGSRAEP